MSISKINSFLSADNKIMKVRFISSVNDLKLISQDEQVFICGYAVFFALASSGLTPINSKRYIEQQPRPITSKFNLIKKEDTLRVWVLEEMLIAIKQMKQQPKLAIDQYLSWGFKQKQDTVIFGSDENANSTNLEILVFKNGRLINTQERNLYARTHRDFTNQIDLVFSDIIKGFRGYNLAVASPLGDMFKETPSGQLCQAIGNDPFKMRVSIELDYGEKNNNYQRFLVPASIAIVSIIIYSVIVGHIWDNYYNAIKEYQITNQGADGFNEFLLHKLEAQHGFLIASQPQIDIIDKVRLIATAIASVDRVQVQKLFVRGADLKYTKYTELSSDASFGVVAETPLLNESTKLEQARPVLDQLAIAIGSKLRGIRQDEITDANSKQKRLLITFDGS
jgi:hypothetical protein